jgi:hypothetical protein
MFFSPLVQEPTLLGAVASLYYELTAPERIYLLLI